MSPDPGPEPRTAPAGDEDDVAPLPRRPPRWLALVVSVAAAGCLLAACFSHRWLANKYLGDFGFSPLSLQVCSGPSGCQTQSNFQVVELTRQSPFEEHWASRAFPIAGIATFASLLIAAAGLLVSAALAATHRKPDLPVSPTTVALLGLMIGLIAGCVFVATKPGSVGEVGAAWSFWAFGVGSVAGFAGAQQLARQIRPADPDLLHDAMYEDQF